MHPGTVVASRFEIESLAAVGGMGKVYRARDRHTGGTVALKVLTMPGQEGTDRFVREADVLLQLKHPAIVRYVAHGATPGGELYLATEWLDGETLAKRLEQGQLGIAESLSLVRRIAEALAEVHARGVVHRDIKPSNLFLHGGLLGRVKILD